MNVPQKINVDSPPKITHHNYNIITIVTFEDHSQYVSTSAKLQRQFASSVVSCCRRFLRQQLLRPFFLRASDTSKQFESRKQICRICRSTVMLGFMHGMLGKPCNSDMVWDHIRACLRIGYPQIPWLIVNFPPKKIWGHQNLRISALKPQNPAIFWGSTDSQTRRISESLAQPDKGGSTLAGGTKFIPALSWAAGGNQPTQPQKNTIYPLVI